VRERIKKGLRKKKRPNNLKKAYKYKQLTNIPKNKTMEEKK